MLLKILKTIYISGILSVIDFISTSLWTDWHVTLLMIFVFYHSLTLSLYHRPTLWGLKWQKLEYEVDKLNWSTAVLQSGELWFIWREWGTWKLVTGLPSARPSSHQAHSSSFLNLKRYLRLFISALPSLLWVRRKCLITHFQRKFKPRELCSSQVKASRSLRKSCPSEPPGSVKTIHHQLYSLFLLGTPKWEDISVSQELE